MRGSARHTLLLLACLTFIPHARSEAPAQAPPTGQRVFTAGHSFHMSIVGLLAEIAKSANIDHKSAGAQSLGGSSVTQHWNLPDDRNKAKKALTAGEVDVLTLSPHFKLPDPAIDQFTALLLEHNPSGRVLVQVSWLLRDGVADRSFDNAARDNLTAEQIRAAAAEYATKLRGQAAAINAQYADKLKRQVVFVVPSGEALTILREKVAKGEVPGIAKPSELFRDVAGHGKEAVNLLNAYCHFAVIYGRSPVGLAAPASFRKAGLGDNTDKVNAILQEIAWQAVTAEPGSGVELKSAD